MKNERTQIMPATANAARPYRHVAMICAAVALWLLSLLYAHSVERVFVDESVHVPQVQYFLQGKFVFHPYLTTIPGYHFVMAAMAKLLSVESLGGMRAISAIFGITAGLMFYLVRRRLGDPHAMRAAALLFVMPFLYPYYFLVYTDVLSLSLILAALIATLSQRHVLAAIALAASVLVRQNNVMWAAFMPVLSLWPALEAAGWRPWRMWKPFIAIAAPYALPVAIFLGYWAWNGTISLSKTVAPGHPDLKIHTGNIYYTLFVCFIFFPLDIWRGAGAFFQKARRQPWLFLVPLIVIAYAKIKGSPDNYFSFDYFIHNAILQQIKQGGWVRWLFGVIAAIAACGLAFTRFAVPQGWLVYPFSAAYLASSWLIESRYSIIPVALWMALRSTDDKKSDWIRLGAWAALSMMLTWGIFSGRFML